MIAVGPDSQVYNGHQRLNVLMQQHGADYEVDVRISSRALTEKEREKLTIYLHKGATGEFNFDILANEFELSELLEWGFSEKELDLNLWAGEIEDDPKPESEEDNRPDFMPAVDYFFPSDNEYGIPNLDLSMQARALAAPIARWGQKSRHSPSQKTGTFHFYTEDYKFAALWRDPLTILLSHCTTIIEPNFSTNDMLPLAVGIYNTFRKRWLAAYWQKCGVSVIVDLNVASKFDQINLLGVPNGWLAYATRYYQDLGELELLRQFEIGKAKAGQDNILFCVCGGGKESFEICRKHSWLYIPQENHVVEGRYNG